jgi:4-amino-4-deoxy-L-arabinose transferase-like glycosyltransferase
MAENRLLSRLATGSRSVLRLRWWLVTGLFVVGLLLRLPMMGGPHREGDEVIYRSLVGQLEQGHGYTLQKSILVERGIIDRYQYDRPLFHHPPGGIALFWLSHQVFGESGLPLVQLFSFSLFFWSMSLLAHALGVSKSDLGLFLVALLSSFNPIVAHVTTKYWLDAPLLAFASFGAALFMVSFVKTRAATVGRMATGGPVKRSKRPSSGQRAIGRAGQTSPNARPAGRRYALLAIAAGAIIGYASLIKVTALVVLPCVFLLCLALTPPPKWKSLLLHALFFVVPALVVQAPWELWQWAAVGSPFPQWAGKPSATLVESNRYVHFLTVVRSPWVYLTLTPMVMATILPSLALLVLFYLPEEKTDSLSSGFPLRPEVARGFLLMSSARALATACLLWLLVVIGFHIALGFAGYSKLLRYIILATPASILLPALLAPHAWDTLSSKGSLVRVLRLPIMLCLAVGTVAEVAVGISAAFHVQQTLIVPFIEH